MGDGYCNTDSELVSQIWYGFSTLELMSRRESASEYYKMLSEEESKAKREGKKIKLPILTVKYRSRNHS